jgi:hypothetical protein
MINKLRRLFIFSPALVRTFLFFAFLFLLAQYSEAENGKYYVKVRSTKLRSAPQHFAPPVSDLKLGDAVTGTEAGDGWYKVSTASKKSGYLHAATLTTAKIITDASKKYNPTADSSDVVLAGKGFNKEVEKEFSAKNPNLNFVEVNIMDQINVRDADEIAFVKSGGLKTNG